MRNADGDLDAPLLQGEGPILDGLADQLAIRHDNFGVVPLPDAARADADAPYDAARLPDFDLVPDVHRALEQQNQARNEIVEYVLKAEPDAHAERADQHRDARQIEAGGADREEEPQEQDEVVDDRRDGVRDPVFQREARVDVLLEREADKPREQKRRPDDREKQQDVAGRDVQGP